LEVTEGGDPGEGKSEGKTTKGESTGGNTPSIEILSETGDHVGVISASKIEGEPGTGRNPEPTKPKLSNAEMGAARSEIGPLNFHGRVEVSKTNPSVKGRTITCSVGVV
jgi:hypothetical protein